MNTKQIARQIIEGDEYIQKNPDDIRDMLEDIRSWGIDLARAFVHPEEEYELRQSVTVESDND